MIVLMDCLNPALVDQSHLARELSFDGADTSTSDETLKVRDQAVFFFDCNI